jgi:hypothetical protein
MALKRIIRDKKIDSQKLIEKSIKAVPMQTVRNCIEDGVN